MQNVGFDTESILNRASKIGRKLALIDVMTTRAVLDLGVDMLHTLFEHDVRTWKPEAAPLYQQTALLEHAGRRQGVIRAMAARW